MADFKDIWIKTYEGARQNLCTKRKGLPPMAVDNDKNKKGFSGHFKLGVRGQ